MIELTKVKSSLISGVHYDAEKKVLYVEFLRKQTQAKRSIYAYADVPSDKVQAMLADKSIGSYFLNRIKPDYQFTKIEEEIEKATENADRSL